MAKGAPLAVITSPELAHAVPDKLKAEADLAAAEGEDQRQRQLFDAHEGVTERLEAARAGLASARAELERARARAALVKSLAGDEMTGSFTLFAPIGGVVLASAAAPGAVVAGQGAGRRRGRPVHDRDPAPGLGDTAGSAMRTGRASASGRGSPSRSLLCRGRTFAGRVVRISAPGPALHEVAVRCAVANTGGVLKPGMAATVAIVVAARCGTSGRIAGPVAAGSSRTGRVPADPSPGAAARSSGTERGAGTLTP